MYLLGCFWDKIQIISDLQNKADLLLGDAIYIEREQRLFSHNLINEKLLNYDLSNLPSKLIWKIKSKISDIILHNLKDVKLYIEGSKDILDYKKTGISHNETKFNPIDNDNQDANLVSADNTTYSILQNLSTAQQLIDILNKTKENIDKELNGLLLNNMSVEIYEMGSDDIVINDLALITDLGELADNNDLTIMSAFIDKNPNIKFINNEIFNYFVFSKKTATECIANLTINNFFSLNEVLTLTYTLPDETNI